MIVDTHATHIIAYIVNMTLRCSRCKVWKNDEDYTYKTKKGYFYTNCDACRDKLTSYRSDTIKQQIKEERINTTTTMICECGKKITLHGNADYYIRRHIETKAHKERVRASQD